MIDNNYQQHPISKRHSEIAPDIWKEVKRIQSASRQNNYLAGFAAFCIIVGVLLYGSRFVLTSQLPPSINLLFSCTGCVCAWRCYYVARSLRRKAQALADRYQSYTLFDIK